MKIKSLVLTAVLATAILCLGTGVSAQATSLQEQINLIMQQIAQLTSQLQALRAQQNGSSSAWCFTFTKYLIVGSTDETTGGQVSQLQTALVNEKYGYVQGDPKGVFEENTAAGVVAFQSDHGITPTGTVGPITRTKLNEHYGCHEGVALTVSKDASSPASDIILSGETSTVAVFKLSSTSSEDLDVDKIQIVSQGPAWIDMLYLFDGSTLLGTAAPGDPAVFVLADNTLVIPQNSYKQVTLKIKTTVSVPNGFEINCYFDNVTATGKTSGASVTSSEDVYGNKMKAYKSRPYFTKNTSSPSGYLIPSSAELLAIFDVKASAGADVSFMNGANSIKINRNKQQFDSSGSNKTYVLKDGDGTTLDTVAVADSATSLVFDFSTASFVVPAGATKKLYIYGDTTGLEDQGDAIQLWLDDSNASNISWGIDGAGVYGEADKIFRGNIYANALTRGDPTYCTLDNKCSTSGTGKACVFDADCAPAPIVTITSPLSGQTYKVGETVKIKWTSANLGSSEKVRLDLWEADVGHSGTSEIITTTNTGEYGWVVPAGTAPMKYQISLYTNYVNNYPKINVVSGQFTITSAVQSSITVTAPTSGETIKTGTSYTIKWNSQGVSNVYIKLRKGTDTYPGHEGAVVMTIPNTGSYTWAVPTTLPAGNNYAIRVIDPASMALSDSGNFIIVQSCAQDGSKVYGSSVFGPTTCCSKNAGIRPSGVLSGTACIAPNDGSLGTCVDNWWKTCGDGICQNTACTAIGCPLPEDKCSCHKDCSTSSPLITVISPNGGESLTMGNTYRIKWNSTDVDYVSISLTDNDLVGRPNVGSGASMTIVGPISASSGFYDWPVPSSVSGLPHDGNRQRYSNSSYVIKISQAFCTTSGMTTSCTYGVTDSSNSNFSIMSSVTTCTSFTYSAWSACTYDPVLLNQIAQLQAQIAQTTDTIQLQALYAQLQVLQQKLGTDKIQTRTVLTSLPAGCAGGNPITSQKCPTTPSITVTSPNGGETYNFGSQIPISWNDTTKAGVAGIWLLKSDKSRVGVIGQGKPSSEISNTFLWDGKTACQGFSGYIGSNCFTISPGSYIIQVLSNGADATGKNLTDESDSYFKIVNYDACRLDKLDGTNITRNALYDQTSCLSQLCDVYGPANQNQLSSKCMFNGVEIKRYMQSGYSCPGYSDNAVVINSVTPSQGKVSFNLTNTKSSDQTISVLIESGTVNPSSIAVAAGTCAKPTSVTYNTASDTTINFKLSSGQVIASQPVSSTTSASLSDIQAMLASVAQSVLNLLKNR